MPCADRVIDELAPTRNVEIRNLTTPPVSGSTKATVVECQISPFVAVTVTTAQTAEPTGAQQHSDGQLERRDTGTVTARRSVLCVV